MNEHERWVSDWLKKGDTDYETALVVWQSNKGLFDAVCFHCQQCVEKYLKGFLIFSGKAVSKTHDLERLLQECIEVDDAFTAWREPCLILTDYAVDIRYPYPDAYTETTRGDAEEALRHAEALRAFVRSRLPFLHEN